MTRTAVRRHVDVSDGRLVIRKIVVEAPVCEPTSVVEPIVTDTRDAQRVDRFRTLSRARHALRDRGDRQP
jgi:hypothetical protein